MIPLPGPDPSAKKRLNGRQFALGFIVFLLIVLGGAFTLREKRIRDWRAAGGESIREGVTLPVRQR
jgi:hypothetical protein